MKATVYICRSADLRILNGRVSGDLLGRARFHWGNGTCKRRWLRNMWPRFIFIGRTLIVKEPSCFSDHSPVITLLIIAMNICNKNVAPANDTLKRLPKQFCWENDSTKMLMREFLNESEPTTNVNASLKKVEHFLGKTLLKHNCMKSSSNKKWFDKECRLKNNMN